MMQIRVEEAPLAGLVCDGYDNLKVDVGHLKVCVNTANAVKETNSKDEMTSVVAKDAVDSPQLFTPFSSSSYRSPLIHTVRSNKSFYFDQDSEGSLSSLDIDSNGYDLDQSYSDAYDSDSDSNDDDTDSEALLDRLTPPPPFSFAANKSGSNNDREECEYDYPNHNNDNNHNHNDEEEKTKHARYLDYELSNAAQQVEHDLNVDLSFQSFVISPATHEPQSKSTPWSIPTKEDDAYGSTLEHNFVSQVSTVPAIANCKFDHKTYKRKTFDWSGPPQVDPTFVNTHMHALFDGCLSE
eukprot:CAMPEP_0202733886 /NCGR_PEP_ID=MMETSP1385-20130828/188398_1 /ASSEMBLY_ACC=CAM_ASM_000861 /TAXON_ID=933848 /ORGANISM="Elphidium margaritaceum" /LENGTH=295 /DNA_ID=CAMNT_0049400231 /DNA_START=138 /DNA_END=1025 /DNA_ORIENTATION=+